VSFEVDASALNAPTVLVWIRANNLDDAETLVHSRCEVAPRLSRSLDCVHGIHDNAGTRGQRPLSDSFGDDIGGKTGRLITLDPRPPHRCFERVNPDIGRCQHLGDDSSNGCLSRARKPTQHHQHRQTVPEGRNDNVTIPLREAFRNHRDRVGKHDAVGIVAVVALTDTATCQPARARRGRDDGLMSPLDELAPGLWGFSVIRNGLPPTMTAYALRDGEDTILVDPLVAGETEPLLAALDEIVRGRVRILVTTPFHVRGSELLWRHWRDRHEVTIFGHEHCATRLDDRSAFRPLRGGETLDGGVRAHPIGQPRRAEIPFELPSHQALAFGDSVLEIDGELRVWPRHRNGERRRTWYEQRFLPTLRPLTELDIERVLVTHGEPVLRDGARALAASLARPPWSRSSLY
jgi:hypothetical protein